MEVVVVVAVTYAHVQRKTSVAMAERGLRYVKDG
jgi:hypothetical protein